MRLCKSFLRWAFPGNKRSMGKGYIMMTTEVSDMAPWAKEYGQPLQTGKTHGFICSPKAPRMSIALLTTEC
jgi:hypothetical protein